jgi:hypothetical protein
MRLVAGTWRNAAEMAAELRTLPDAAGSGDVYALLAP